MHQCNVIMYTHVASMHVCMSVCARGVCVCKYLCVFAGLVYMFCIRLSISDVLCNTNKWHHVCIRTRI
jgi:hypothetical protein